MTGRRPLTDEDQWIEDTVAELAARVTDRSLLLELLEHGEIGLAIEMLVGGLGDDGVDEDTLGRLRVLAAHIERAHKLCVEPVVGTPTYRVWWRDRRAELTEACSSALRDHDPLEPWLTESHFDDDYWQLEAEQIATRLDPGMSADDVRDVVVSVLAHSIAPAVAGDGLDPWRTAQLDRAAAATHAALRSIYP